jgi:hypothetical protein
MTIEAQDIQKTIDIWKFLAEDGNREKEDFPSFAQEYSHLEAECPLCDVIASICTGCPLNTAGQCCYNAGSHYDTWGMQSVFATTQEEFVTIRAKAAQGIVDICEKALAKLKDDSKSQGDKP